MAGDVFVHPNALNESESIGRGTRIWAFAHIMRGAVVRTDCNIGDHSFIESGADVGNGVTIKNGVCIWEGVKIEDFVFIGPGVMFTNDRYPRSPRAPVAQERYSKKENWLLPTLIREGASIGAKAVILAGVTIGRYATVAAGALVARNVPDFSLVAGNPAVAIGHVCMCGHPLPASLECISCDRVYEKIDGQLRLRGEEGAAE